MLEAVANGRAGPDGGTITVSELWDGLGALYDEYQAASNSLAAKRLMRAMIPLGGGAWWEITP
jgi:hypothetical protein